MANEPLSKPLDRDRPFKRINNDAFLVKKAPDGLGLACGCQRPEDFGKIEEEFEKFLDDNLPIPILNILKTVRDVAKAVATVAKIAAAAALALPFLASAGIVGVILGIAVVVGAISSIISDVLDAIETGVRTFFNSIGKKLLRRAIRNLPQWVPVSKGASDQSVSKEQIIEMQGTVTRSYGNPNEAPFFQWHRWFNWNVQVKPDAEYSKALSPAGDPPNKDGFTGSESAVNRDGSFEIQWDAGALWSPEEAAAFEAGFTDDDMPKHDGPMLFTDWCWPTTGMFVWAAGRWVYDCSRTTDDSSPQMPAMINPAKAMATARWKAVKFAENDAGVPAIQFMFITSKRGGYINSDAINDQDYEFILDLPPAPDSAPAFPMGHTGHVTANTIVLRPHLLRDVVVPALGGLTKIDPVVELIRPQDGKKVPTQVKVKIPLTSLPGNVPAAGCILSLGWSDPGLQQARKVKRCKLTLSGFSGRLKVRDSGLKKFREAFPDAEKDLRDAIGNQIGKITIFGIPVMSIPGVKQLVQEMVDAGITALLNAIQENAPLETEEWLLRVGVNGVWKSRYLKTVRSQAEAFSPPISFDDLFLGPDDFLFITVNGIEFDPVGDMMRAPHSKRIITDGSEVPWPKIVKPDSNSETAKKKRRNMAFQYVLKIMTDTTSGKLALGLEDSPLGLIEPDFANKGTASESNPLLMKGIGTPTLQIRRTAKFARAAGEQLILAEDSGTDDYFIDYILQIENAVQ